MKIKLFVMDVDGTLTDGCIYVGAEGEVMKAFHVRDGYAIAHTLPAAGIIPAIITGRTSQIVAARARELRIPEVHQGVSDKLSKLKHLAERYHVTPEEIAYIGDDVNDLDCMAYAGISACPADAMEQVAEQADYVCTCAGGRGAVREFADELVRRG